MKLLIHMYVNCVLYIYLFIYLCINKYDVINDTLFHDLSCNRVHPWWRHQMETFSALLFLFAGNSPVTGGFPSERPVTMSFDVLCDLRLNKRLSKPSRCRWFETPSRSLIKWIPNQITGNDTLVPLEWRHIASLRLKSPATRQFVHSLIQAGNKRNTIASHHWPFVSGIHRWPVDSPCKWSKTQKTFPFHDVILAKVALAVMSVVSGKKVLPLQMITPGASFTNMV